MPDPLQLLTERFADAIIAAFGSDYAAVDPIIAPAKSVQFGDYQANAAMSLAKSLGKKPRDVAQAIVDHLQWQDICEEIPGVAGPGFINIKLGNACLAAAAAEMMTHLQQGRAAAPVEHPRNIVVDYSGPNVAKEMHVGHLRSSVIGDALVRVLQQRGHHVIRQNHLGDWGTQFGMLIEHLNDLGLLSQNLAGNIQIQDLNNFYREAKVKFDAQPDFADRARKRVVLLQSGDDRSLLGWKMLVEISKSHFQPVYHALNILLTRDDIRGESFYNDQLPGVAADLENSGTAQISDGALCVFIPPFESPLIVRKADGGFGYDATDLAAIRYRVDQLHADRIIYVTDSRQIEHFQKVFACARRGRFISPAPAPGTEVQLDHVPFGTVLGEDGKPFKTRSGDTVKLVDLLDEARQKARTVAESVNNRRPPDERLPAGELDEVARMVGIGAIKYADLANDRRKDYQFVWSRMLAMDGNTAPYLQYAYARIQSIFRRGQLTAPAAIFEGVSPRVPISLTHPAERTLILKALQLPGVLRAVERNLEPHHLCNWLYELATAFSSFYENCPVLSGGADDPAVRNSRLTLCRLTADALKLALSTLGIEVPQRM
ncbi:MAG: arginine--tRNA ligase [Phycisphaerales bacterium]